MNFCGSARTDWAINKLAWSLIDPKPKPPNDVMFWSAASPEDDEEEELDPFDVGSVELNSS